jgi:hypothetical protein
MIVLRRLASGARGRKKWAPTPPPGPKKVPARPLSLASKIITLVSYTGFVASSYMVLVATGALPAPLSGGRLAKPARDQPEPD